MSDKSDIFVPESYYHVYNRAVTGSKLFLEDKNHLFFLQKYDKYLSDFLDTYCYCLLPNHFHFLVRIKENNPNKSQNDYDQRISQQFRKFFISYAMSFNNLYDRKGTLFQRPFKRKWIDSEEYLLCLVYYIHSNPERHRITEDFKTYKLSSYEKIQGDYPSKLKGKELLEWFGGLKEYVRFHEEIQNIDRIRHLTIE